VRSRPARSASVGDGVNAKHAMPGGDWMTVSNDRFARPDVQVQLVTDDGALILLHYTGLVERSDALRRGGRGR
jgi:Protein of unknown function (DUF3237)